MTDRIKIVRGEDRKFNVRIRDAQTGDAYDLTAVTAIKAILKGDSTNVNITQAASEINIISPAVNGRIELIWSDSKTPLLKVGDAQTLEIEIDEGANKRILQIKKSIDVVNRI